MNLIYIPIILIFGLSGLGIIESELESYENNLGYNFPVEFKSYINNFDDDKDYIVHIMHDSFQIITNNNIEFLKDEIFDEIGLAKEIDIYISRELGNSSAKALPFARSLSGDRYGYLFLLYDPSQSEDLMIYHKDLDRAIYKTIPLGNFFNYVDPKPTTHSEKKIVITQNHSISKFIGDYPQIDVLDYIDESKLIEKSKDAPELISQINIETAEAGTRITFTHRLKGKASEVLFTVAYLDRTASHKYSYENYLLYNYYSLLQYYLIQSINKLVELEEVDLEEFKVITKDVNLKTITSQLKSN